MQNRPNTFNEEAPANYVAGLGRGAVGFTTRSDIGPARGAAGGGAGRGSARPEPPTVSFGVAPAGYVAGQGRGAGGFGRGGAMPGDGSAEAAQLGGAGVGRGAGGKPSEGGPVNLNSYDEFSGYSEKLFDDTPYEADDAEADATFDKIEEHMAGRRKRHREERERAEAEKARMGRPRIADQFSDLKTELADVSTEAWDAIPEVGDRSLKYKQKDAYEKYTPVPDSIIDMQRTDNKTVGAIDDGHSGGSGFDAAALGGLGTDVGATTDLKGLSEARGTVLSLKLAKMSDSVSGQTVVDPKGYMTSLSSVAVSSSSDIADFKRAELLLTSLTTTNPGNAPGWIGLARVYKTANKLVQARKTIKRGCEACPDNEDVWLEAAELATPSNARVILANAVRHVPTSVKVWMRAADLETEPRLKKAVLRRALIFVPNSVKLWKAAVEAEDEAEAKVLLARAVECVPHSVEMWLALAKLETYDNARKVLNDARRAVPTDASIWIAAAQLEEAAGAGHEDNVERIIARAVESLRAHQAVLDRDTWLNHALEAERAGSPLTCAAIIRATLSLGVEDEDRKRTWTADADEFVSKGAFAAARAVYAYTLKVFPTAQAVWRAAAALEQKHGSFEDLDAILKRACEHCPTAENLWLMAAKEHWMHGSVPTARAILREAFKTNPNSERIWLAAVKLEWENGELGLARKLLATARENAPSPRVWMKSALLEREDPAAGAGAERVLLDEGLEKFPLDWKMWLMRAQAEEAAGNVEAARTQYRQGLQHCPKCIPMWIAAARLEEKSRKSVIKARSVLEVARLKNPKSPQLWLEAVQLEARSGAHALSQSLLAKALQDCPTSGILWAENIRSAPKPQQKRRSMDALSKCGNDDPAVVLAVAQLFARDRKWANARKWFNRAVLLDGDIGDAWAHYYRFELLRGDSASQADVLTRFNDADPHHGELWCSVAKAHGNRGLPRDEVLRRCVALLDAEAGSAPTLAAGPAAGGAGGGAAAGAAAASTAATSGHASPAPAASGGSSAAGNR